MAFAQAEQHAMAPRDASMDSVARFGSVPFSRPEPGAATHTMWFASRSAQQSYMQGACSVHEMSGAYFVRPDRGFCRVDCESTKLYGCNYMMFQNPPDNMWWYAFIISVDYVNDTTCQVNFEIDVLQTWLVGMKLTECYVEREHVNDDTVGANILDEPVSTGELKYLATDGCTELNTLDVVVESAVKPKVNDDGSVSQDDSVGGFIGQYYCGCNKFIWSNGLAGLSDFLLQLNLCGAGSSISSIYLYPHALVPGSWNVNSDKGIFTSGGQSLAIPSSIVWAPSTTVGTTLDGYTPKNKKLLTYPYNFLRVTTYRGTYHDYRYEFFDGDPEFNVWGLPDPTADLYCAPNGYNGMGGFNVEYVNLGGYAMASWTYNAYQNWLAQNSGSNLMNLISGAASVIGGVALAGATAGGSLAVSGSTIAAAAAGSGSAGMIAGGVGSLAGTAGGYINAQHAPDKIMGTTSAAALTAYGLNTFFAYRMGVRAQIARVIDEFFSMYGYEVDTVKVPNFTGRAHWNYVKTRNACMRGEAPATDMSRINALLDSGVTFWHDADVGNYSQDNPIV